MIYKEEFKSIFTLGGEWWMAHCISDDYALGAGIAVEFDRRYHVKDELNMLRRKGIPYLSFKDTNGHCVVTSSHILNLVTKEKCYYKPTYTTVRNALNSMGRYIEMHNTTTTKEEDKITKVAMPRIASGLDKLDFKKVREIIKDTLNDLDIEVLVCIYQ